MRKRKILLPFALIYSLVMSIRNFSYQKGLRRSTSFDLPIINIGNLSVGGTGKSPFTMYLIELLKDNYMVCTLSRGYGRATKGFRLANYDSKALDIGDEPLQFFNRYKNKIMVTVSEDRVKGVEIINNELKPEVILLDDAFQHRKIKPGFQILLTPYNDLYVDDYVLPAGGLRESRRGAKRADVIVVTKCPDNLLDGEKQKIQQKLKPKNQNIYFSTVVYEENILGKHNRKIVSKHYPKINILLVTGIAKSEGLLQYVSDQFAMVEHLEFSDHHNYTYSDVNKILDKYAELPDKKIILTTEKDFMRLNEYKELDEILYYLPITVNIDREKEFNQEILHYVREHAQSSGIY